MRWRWTIIPVSPTISARAQRSKSIGPTFSSMIVTLWPEGVSAAIKGSAAGGMLARRPIKGMACSSPQYDISNRGLIRTMSAMPLPFLFAGDDTLDPFPQLGKDTGLLGPREDWSFRSGDFHLLRNFRLRHRQRRHDLFHSHTRLQPPEAGDMQGGGNPDRQDEVVRRTQWNFRMVRCDRRTVAHAGDVVEF